MSLSMVIFFHDLEHETTTCFTIGDYSLCYSHVLSQILSKYLLSMAKINIPNVFCFGLLGLKKMSGGKSPKISQVEVMGSLNVGSKPARI